MKLKNSHGFTLLEVLIALFIFTLIAVIITRGLHMVLTLQESSQKKAIQFRHIQMAFVFLSRDFEQIINRPVMNAKKILEKSFIGTPESVSFTHGGLPNPGWQLTQSTLQRVQYRFTNGTLWRDTWQVLDQTSHSLPESRALLKNITAWRFQYLDKDLKFQDHWPAENTSSSPELPRAIQLSFSIKNSGNIKQLYIISGKSLEKPQKTSP